MVNELYDPDDKRGSFGSIGVIEEKVVYAPAQSAPPPAPPAARTRSFLPIDFLVKDDGDFTAGPGDFVPVPKTKLKFRTEAYCPALFFVQASFGWTGYQARHDRLGLLVDDVAYPILEQESMVDAATAIFSVSPGCHWAMNLAPGEHVVQLLLRGGKDEGQTKTGLWLPSKVLANQRNPLVLSVLHG